MGLWRGRRVADKAQNDLSTEVITKPTLPALKRVSKDVEKTTLRLQAAGVIGMLNLANHIWLVDGISVYATFVNFKLFLLSAGCVMDHQFYTK